MRFNILTLLIIAALSFNSCTKQKVKLYEQNAGVRFVANEAGKYEKAFSFALVGGADEAIVEIPVTISGLTSKNERNFDIKIVNRDASDDFFPAPEEMYETMQGIIPVDSINGFARIKLFNNTILDTEDRHVEIQIVASDDFPLTDLACDNFILSFTGMVVKPVLWDDYFHYYFGNYSREWHNFIASVTGVVELDNIANPNWENELNGWGDLEQRIMYAASPEIKKFRPMLKKALMEYEEENGEPFTHGDGSPIIF